MQEWVTGSHCAILSAVGTSGREGLMILIQQTNTASTFGIVQMGLYPISQSPMVTCFCHRYFGVAIHIPIGDGEGIPQTVAHSWVL